MLVLVTIYGKCFHVVVSALFIVHFLLNISDGLAAPFYRMATPPANPIVYANTILMFNVSVIELVSSTFTSTVMDPTKVGSHVYASDRLFFTGYGSSSLQQMVQSLFNFLANLLLTGVFLSLCG